MPLQHRKNSLFPINFTTGISDGLTLPFVACMIAFPFLANNALPVISIGLSVTLIGTVAYGLARYFGEREEIKHNHPEIAMGEAEQEIALMNAIGIDQELTQEMQAQMEAERALWLSEVREYGMGWEEDDAARARDSGLHTAAGFFVGGLAVTLSFYFVNADILRLVLPCAVFTLLYTFFGWLKGYYVSPNPFRYALIKSAKGMIILILVLVATLFIAVRKERASFNIYQSMVDITP
jgi:VIT1/CCC1 family predicted Fe2+/Mn2+ transporter